MRKRRPLQSVSGALSLAGQKPASRDNSNRVYHPVFYTPKKQHATDLSETPSVGNRRITRATPNSICAIDFVPTLFVISGQKLASRDTCFDFNRPVFLTPRRAQLPK